MHLYIIQSDKTGDFKIGRSKHPEKRLKQLQTGNQNKLKLILVVENSGHLEKRIHNSIKEKSRQKSRGEWFEFNLSTYLPLEIYESIDLDVFNVWWDKH
jgi:hypothetical protein